MTEIISRRNGKVIDIGNSVGLTLREELLDLGLEIGSIAQITVLENNGKKKIVIERVR